MIKLLEYLESRDGRTMPNLYATSERLACASNRSHVPVLYNEILGALSGPTMHAVWQSSSPWAEHLLPNICSLDFEADRDARLVHGLANESLQLPSARSKEAIAVERL